MHSMEDAAMPEGLMFWQVRRLMRAGDWCASGGGVGHDSGQHAVVREVAAGAPGCAGAIILLSSRLLITICRILLGRCAARSDVGRAHALMDDLYTYEDAFSLLQSVCSVTRAHARETQTGSRHAAACSQLPA